MLKKTIAERYQGLSQIEHVLRKPTMYIGSITTEKRTLYLPDNLTDIKNIKLIQKEIDYNNGLVKIFDEILVNASDQFIRTNGAVKNISITVDKEKIIIENDGPGIPVEKHPEHNIYLGEMLFGRLLTSENYDDNDERNVSGTFGIGAKATNIFSTTFIVESADGKNKFKQEFYNNLSKKSEPAVKPSNKNFTKITFYPDLQRFGFTEITEDTQKLLLKRCLDIAMYCPKAKVYFNEQQLPVKSFKDYVALYTDGKEIIYEKINDSWEIGVVGTDNYEQTSIVNGTYTYRGGTHVAIVTNYIVNKITETLQKKHKDVKINQSDIKRHLWIFVNCKITNPIFDTQTKEYLTSRISPDQVEMSDAFIKKIINSSIMEDILAAIAAREEMLLKQKSGKKTTFVKVPKLIDANKAGTNESKKCTIFFTEGDSASSSVLAGLSKEDRNYYGIFPLKGKILNVRDITPSKIAQHEEVKRIIDILGLEFGKKYYNVDELRYGKICLCADNDNDGLHIKGLLINLFEHLWPEILDLDFIYEMLTPIVKATKGKDLRYFYKLNDYKKFKEDVANKGYFYKYYKGLGTIEPVEFKLFFKNIDKHLTPIKHSNEEEHQLVDLIFNKKRADDRKDWIGKTYRPDIEVDKFSRNTTIESFINDEFIEFSMYDNIRSIPSLVDGLKPSQRKILYTLFHKNYSNEVKVSQLSGAVIEYSAYHHGPVSLDETIIGMAQNFVGSNNINLLMPNGQFGTRLHGGGDSASPRYVYTKLNKVTRKLFKDEDDDVLFYLNDDGNPIEPRYYVPVIPMVLINGAKGIGSGYSTDVPSYNIKDIIQYYKNKLEGKNNRKELVPYYEGFKGTIIWNEETQAFVTKGTFEIQNSRNIKVTELPIGVWTQKYYEFLDTLIENKSIIRYSSNCTDEEIDITVVFSDLPEINTVSKLLGLETNIKLTNLVLFNTDSQLKRYDTIDDILEEFYTIRIEYYNKRKEYQIKQLNKECSILNNKALFIKYYVDDKLKINKRRKAEIEADMIELGLMQVDDSFDYLLNMNISSITRERIEDLLKSIEEKKMRLTGLKEMSAEQLWLIDLDELSKK